MTQGLALSSSSAYVCDSLHLAKKLSVNHGDMLRSLRLASEASAADGGQSAYALSTYRNEQGKEQPKYDLTFEHLITASMYVEKLKPKFREYIKAMRDAETEKAAQLSFENRILDGQLKVAQRQLSEAPRIVQTKYGQKIERPIPMDKKKLNWFDPQTQEPARVLADSLDFDEMFEAITSNGKAKAEGTLSAIAAKMAWKREAVKRIKAGEPIPAMAEFGAFTSFEANLRRALKKKFKNR